MILEERKNNYLKTGYSKGDPVLKIPYRMDASEVVKLQSWQTTLKRTDPAQHTCLLLYF